jgi:tetratricopeptide (TPR) repeat protein
MYSPGIVNRSPPNVLSLVNKGLALYQWKQEIGAAERCCHEALRIDPECEAAVATLAQLSLQQAKIPEAVKMFERQAELARSEPELINALTYQYVSLLYGRLRRVYADDAVSCRLPLRRLSSCTPTLIWQRS